MKNLFFIAILLITLFSLGCQTEKNIEPPKPNTNQAKTEKAAGGYTVDFKTIPPQPLATQAATLSLTVKNPNGEIVKDLPFVHEKPIHLIVISDDMEEFFHLHPQLQPDGSYQVTHTFPFGGNYKIYADFTPAGSSQIVQKFDLTVNGFGRERKLVQYDQQFEKIFDNSRVVMKPNSELTAGKEIMLNYEVFDAETNQPVNDLEKYLGEAAHFVIVSQDFQHFLHAHPMAMDNVKDSEHQHSEDKMSSTAAKSTFAAHVTFPQPGIYKVWAEFQRSGKVTVASFVLNVQDKQSASQKTSDVKIPEGAFRITVNKNGFTPPDITFPTGKPIKLAFVREDAENCADEIVFPEMKIRKKLPVGQAVLVEINRPEAGAINFACGKDMLKGKIILTE